MSARAMTAQTMSAPQPPAAAAEALIVGVEIAAGHDGTAELVVSIRYENGVTAPVVLDQDTAFALIRACGAASAGALIGRSWREFFTATSPKEA